ncbi:FAD-dependent monooxygenase [Kribbella sp. NBC_00709]|uniref:FAD-dependent monooxygenase n=1 Tax=Kribbella sp. NBC_00709 TaxID=2975972 RepID=UPI002E2D5236|nr:FAD-dependent monooxygenase [Kribbella sp. NBC_00709]
MSYEVIVVGAGPVGLTLAMELHLAGIEPLVVERLAEPAPQRKSRGVGPLAYEALERRGLGPVLEACQPERKAEKERDHGSAKNHFAWIHKIDPALQDEPDRTGRLIWQPDLERILAEHAATLGITVRRECTVTALVQNEDGVTLTVDTPTGPQELEAAYVVGCDGGRSAIRKLAGFDFPGTAPIMTARQAQVAIADPDKLPPSGRLSGGMLIHGPGVLGTFDFAEGPDVPRGEVTAEELQASVRRVAGVDVTITEVSDALRFTDNARQAATYRIGRVLLAGDAAHVHSPNGGQGLNLGLTDAVNLGWKLAAQVRGVAPEGLLDTYTEERHPAGVAVLDNTRAQSALMLPGPHTDALRDIVSELMDIQEVNQYFGRMLGGLATRYAFQYVKPDDHSLIGSYCPDLTFVTADSDESKLSQFTATGRAVLAVPVGDPAVEVADGWRDRIEIIEIETVKDSRLSAVLMRPDGVIAWACDPDKPTDGALLLEALTTWLGAPA